MDPESQKVAQLRFGLSGVPHRIQDFAQHRFTEFLPNPQDQYPGVAVSDLEFGAEVVVLPGFGSPLKERDEFPALTELFPASIGVHDALESTRGQGEAPLAIEDVAVGGRFRAGDEIALGFQNGYHPTTAFGGGAVADEMRHFVRGTSKEKGPEPSPGLVHRDESSAFGKLRKRVLSQILGVLPGQAFAPKETKKHFPIVLAQRGERGG